MKLIGGIIAWIANKYNTISILFTKVELFIISQITKEEIYLFEILKSLILIFFKALTIEYHNKQIIILFIKKVIKLQTKLHYIDIYSY